ncbi:PLP-dependent transferase [Coniophora puteana RWD-64-598 SS2]|uniref:PLP-dependent transferase n=1 Tax=Coniophora puteana (strain RWD-64-598) TaxID=741705 RepID=A0A5M3MZY6_CONPW|nr:PLP-dependent transferase [Coniophora puteana RWD-64-598 SS2]EIW84374.1 PLP-dependent transferase [Coniophora puteana RWD-64-598 SS2]
MTAIDLSARHRQDADLEPAELIRSGKTPPAFGHDMLSMFMIDPNYTALNNGAYGTLPRPVRVACDALTDRIEASPDRFIKLDMAGMLADARRRVAEFVNVGHDELVLVPNTSHGVATVLRSFEWEEGDVLIGATTTYGSITQTLKYLSDTPPHPRVETFALHFPTSHAQILADWRAFLARVTAAHPLTANANANATANATANANANSTGSPPPTPTQKGYKRGQRKILAVIDALVSNPGALLPWTEMVAACAAHGVWSLVDGAHSLGQEVGLDLGGVSAGPDFWLSNCHKWLSAKRGCAAMYVPRRNQHVVRSPIPTPVTYKSPLDEGYAGPQDFALMFEWTGTIDYVPLLSVVPALEFRRWLGGEQRINAYCRALALRGGALLAHELGTSVLRSTSSSPNDAEDEFTLNMVNVALPIDGDIADSAAITGVFFDTMIAERGVYAAQFRHNGRWWVRASAQIWNEESDFVKLARALQIASDRVQKLAGRGAHVRNKL